MRHTPAPQMNDPPALQLGKRRAVGTYWLQPPACSFLFVFFLEKCMQLMKRDHCRKMDSFTSQTTESSDPVTQCTTSEYSPNLPISMASRFSMACSWPVVATRIMRSIRIVIWSFFFVDKGLTWSLYPRIHTQNHLHSVPIDGSN